MSGSRPRREHPPEVLEIAADYLARARGDASAALVEAVADGIDAASLVSRGFARWGQPPRGKAREW